jgi:hypothetical protein
MDARTIARGIALGRIAIGAAIVAAPTRFTRGWVGDVATQPGAQAISVALGARDVAVGAGSLLALQRGADARAWVAASVLCDAADGIATFSRRDHLPTAGAIGVTTLAGSAALAGLWLLKDL